MELKDQLTYFILTMLNGQEFVVQTDAKTDREFLEKLDKKTFLGGGSNCFTLVQETKSKVKPRTFIKDKIYGVQELDKDGLNPYGKVWSIFDGK